MRIFYLPTPEVLSPPRHRVTLCVWDKEAGTVDTRTVSQGGTLADGTLSVRVDETAATLPTLADLARTLALSQRAGQPPPPRYRVVPPSQLELPSGTLWPIAPDPERQALFDPLPGSVGMVSFLDNVISDLTAAPREKQFARILRRLVRRLRQREGGQADD